MYDRGTSGVITNDSNTFGLKNLKLTIVGRGCIAPRYLWTYRVSQEECARLQESVPYVKI